MNNIITCTFVGPICEARKHKTQLRLHICIKMHIIVYSVSTRFLLLEDCHLYR